jgi:hypothetical protein
MDSDTAPSILQGMCCAGRGEAPVNGKKCCTGLTRDDTYLCNPACVPDGEATTQERPFCCQPATNGGVMGGICTIHISAENSGSGIGGHESYAVEDF